MLDLNSIKQQADLLAICERDTHLKRVANTNGGEYAGPCTFCGGRDRFRVQPHARPFPLWMCRHCTDSKWDTVIGYIARRDNLDPRQREDLGEICRRAGGSGAEPLPGPPLKGREVNQICLPSLEGRAGERFCSDPQPVYAPPSAEWQAAARQVMDECEATLWQPKYQAVRAYLYGRGLRDDTIRHFHLGYCATGAAERYGREIAGLYVPRGLVIPCLAVEQIWYLKVRLVPGIPCQCQHCKAALSGPGHCPHCERDTRYLGVKGNKTNVIFNADELMGVTMAMFCEGELDCITAYQEFGRVLPTVTFGSASNHPDLALWCHYLEPLRSILLTYDADLPGQKGAEWLQTISDYVRLAPLPAGVKDINEYHQQSGNLLAWAANYKEFYSQEIFR
jgi:hypothetical protein